MLKKKKKNEETTEYCLKLSENAQAKAEAVMTLTDDADIPAVFGQAVNVYHHLADLRAEGAEFYLMSADREMTRLRFTFDQNG